MIKVVETPPVIFEKDIYRPEPTRFWILDKKVRSLISKLEAEGWIKRFSEIITTHENLFDFFINLHRLEIEERIRILKEKYPQIYTGEGKWDTVCKRVLLNPTIGIGGIRNFHSKPFKVRCLHLWTAYHLGDKKFSNPIGEFVLSFLKKF